jgi:hypothetical protein
MEILSAKGFLVLFYLIRGALGIKWWWQGCHLDPWSCYFSLKPSNDVISLVYQFSRDRQYTPLKEAEESCCPETIICSHAFKAHSITLWLTWPEGSFLSIWSFRTQNEFVLHPFKIKHNDTKMVQWYGFLKCAWMQCPTGKWVLTWNFPENLHTVSSGSKV